MQHALADFTFFLEMLALCMNRRTRIVNQLRMGSGWKFLLKSSEITSNLYLKYTERKDLAPLFSTYQIQYHAESIQEPLIEKEMTKDPHLLKFWRFITYIDTTIIIKLYNEYITIYILSYIVIIYAYMHEEIAFY